MFLLLSSLALAGPDAALGVSAALGSADQSLALQGRARLDSGWQLGLHAQGDRVQTGFIDGWPVSGARLAGAALVTAPLIQSEPLRVDLEAQLGALSLRPNSGAVSTPNLAMVADLSPMATLTTGRGALRLGWVHLLHYQVRPSAAMDAQGVLLRAEWVLAPSDALQLSLGGRTGGVFGFGGDGGKYLASASLGLRWVPGAAQRWTNF